MRLKTKLVLAITSLVLVVVVIFSWIWMSWLLQQHIEQSFTAINGPAHIDFLVLSYPSAAVHGVKHRVLSKNASRFKNEKCVERKGRQPKFS